jgi:hypothetical protein
MAEDKDIHAEMAPPPVGPSGDPLAGPERTEPALTEAIRAEGLDETVQQFEEMRQASEAAQGDVEPISAEEFERGDPRTVYARMRPDQRTAIAEEFARHFRLSGDPEAQPYATEITTMLSPERVAELHRYAREHHPEILAEVTQHPVTRFSLAEPSARPVRADEAEAAPEAGGDASLPERQGPGLLQP